MERVPSPKPVKLTEKEFTKISRALAEPRRFQLLQCIGSTKEPTACSTLNKSQDISPATLSHHIKELENAGLIETSKEGKFVSITLRRDIFKAYLDKLSQI
ncbi:helix-turn-helix domain-containing protein [Leptospira venezuelensis]|uniref:ArsR/SmtB family transcription factor n=1 Tax=Leptospira venezuelensis TaxID=1958811 RepID=UPI000A386149|nr:helix-turn-helix domain-containing protein [Leptospira venezuelensis]